MIPPQYLCRAHLLGEHYEIHKHRRTFENQYSIEKRRGQIEPRAMAARHRELAAEIVARGYKHTSPYRQPALAYLPKEDRFGTVNRRKSLRELRQRCEACRERIASIKRQERKEARERERQQQSACQEAHA